MPNPPPVSLYQRKSLDQILQVPSDIISVYVVENHIWADGGSDAARAARRAETRTVEEFLISPVRSFLNDIFRLMAAPYQRDRKDAPIGQGYWIQAEFGSGKSHLLSFLGALALGDEAAWKIVDEKERKAGQGRRESLYSFYENGLAKKSIDGKGIFVAVKTLVGQGGGAVGVGGLSKTLTEYVLDAVADQFYRETGKSLPFYPAEILAERFLSTGDFERYRRDLARFLKDPAYFDDEQQEEIGDFLDDLQNNPDPGVRRDCGQRLWDFYERYLQIRPQIPMETEQVLQHMVERLLAEGYAGMLLILDEVSLFMQGRGDADRIEDEKALVVLSNRLAKVQNLPVWTVCAAQQAIETRMAGVKNILARERLDQIALLNKRDYYYDIALSRVREIVEPAAVAQYYEDYKRSFTWPQARGQDEFTRFFPFYPPSIDVVRAISMNLTTVRSALYFMLQTLKTQRKRQSRELISLWSLFDDVVEYQEDPSGTTKAITSVKTKWPDEWRAYETARHQLDTVVKGPLKVYRSRAEKILKTLFLYHIAGMAPNGLTSEELMNSVMEWKDHDKDQQADRQDNLDHYEILADKIELELAQVVRIGPAYRFNPTANRVDPRDHFQKARAEAEQHERQRREAWEALLALDEWQVRTQLMVLDLAHGIHSIFRSVAPASQTDLTLRWHGREITGRVLMRDLLDIGKRGAILPSINSPETGNDFAVFISSTPAGEQIDRLVASKKDPRILFWSPDALTPTEQALLVDFAAYRSLVAEFAGRDTQEAKEVLDWVQARLRDQMGTIYRIVPDSYGRGRIAAQDHQQMAFACQGELGSILTPLVTQALDGVYLCKEMVFDAPAPFNDLNALNVINGIVKVGEIQRGAKPNKDISAAQNYGFALRIMRKPNDRLLDLSDCRYTDDLLAWIEDKLGDGAATMPVVTVYKNFMGMGGPHGVHYGLSKRMVQLYLLCLARQGKIRIALAGGKAAVEAIDYATISEIDFKTALLDAFDQVQRLRPPAGWELLVPYAARLLDDASLTAAKQDVDIQRGLQRLLDFKKEQAKPIQALRAGLDGLFQEIGQPNPLAPRLAAWETFLASPHGGSDPIAHLLNALDSAFGYRVYRDDVVRQDELDDLASRREEIRQAEELYGQRDRLAAAARYTAYETPDEPALADLRERLAQGRAALGQIGALMRNETRLASELLDPVEDAIRSYGVRYLQAFDAVTAATEQARLQVEALAGQPAYRALERLAEAPQLGADPLPALRQAFRAALAGPPELFPAHLTRAEIERNLRAWPQPAGCPLTLQNAAQWIARAAAAQERCVAALAAALRDKAALLHSDALHERLAQGAAEPFIAGLLQCNTVEATAAYLEQTLGVFDAPKAVEAVDLLRRYLKKLRVRKLRLADFSPSKRTLELGDLDAVTAEFRAFLRAGLAAGEDELPVVELE
jgi:hypothetical protein